jgi:hypothetical protein
MDSPWLVRNGHNAPIQTAAQGRITSGRAAKGSAAAPPGFLGARGIRLDECLVPSLKRRSHLIDMIRSHQCDVKHALERKGSPYSLVLTKTTGSFDPSVKRFQSDCRLLSMLPSDS